MSEKTSTKDHREIQETESLDRPLPSSISIPGESLGADSSADLPKNYFKSWQFNAVLLSISFTYATTTGFFVMLATIVPIINEKFGPSDSVIWVVLVTILAQTVTYTLNGRLSDIFGRRWFFISGAFLSFVGFIVSGTAHSLLVIIGGNAISGIGLGVLQSEPALFGELVPNEYRFTVLGLTAGLLTPLIVVTPGLARVFVEQASWRWVFYLSAMFVGISGTLQYFFYFPPSFDQLHRETTRRQLIMNFDYGGTIILVGSVVAFMLGMSWGGQKYAWSSAQTIAPIVIGGVGMLAFFLWEYLVPLKEPLMPLHLFKNRNFVNLSIISAVGTMIFYALNIIYPQQAAAVWGQSITEVGWSTCAILGGVVLGQFIGSAAIKWATRFISLKWQIVLTCILFTAFTGGMANVTADNQARATVFCVISSAMIGLMEVLTIVGALLMVAPEDMGLANGIEFTLRGISTCICASVYTTILSNKTTYYFTKEVTPAVLEAGLPPASLPTLLRNLASGNTAGLFQIPGMTSQIVQAAVKSASIALCKSYQAVYLVSLAFGGVAIILALLIDGKALAEKMTPQIARRLQPAAILNAPNKDIEVGKEV